MKTLIVIVNWRTADLTIDCLRSLAWQVSDPTVDARVIITDNASGDGSIDRIAAAIAESGWTWAETMPLPRNGGFAYGNNAALRARLPLTGGGCEFVLLLNPDTIVRDGALRELVAFMEAHPGVGIAGSRLEDPDGTPQISAFRFHGVPGGARSFGGGTPLGRGSPPARKQARAAPPPPPGRPRRLAGRRQHDHPPSGVRADRSAGRGVFHVLRGGGFLPPGPAGGV